MQILTLSVVALGLAAAIFAIGCNPSRDMSWTRCASAGTKDWRGIALSSDGNSLAATDGADIYIGHSLAMNTGSESGVKPTLSRHNWSSITGPADGSHLVA